MGRARAIDDDTEYVVIGNRSSAGAYREWQRISAKGAPREGLAELTDTLVDPRPGRQFAPV